MREQAYSRRETRERTRTSQQKGTTRRSTTPNPNTLRLRCAASTSTQQAKKRERAQPLLGCTDRQDHHMPAHPAACCAAGPARDALAGVLPLGCLISPARTLPFSDLALREGGRGARKTLFTAVLLCLRACPASPDVLLGAHACPSEQIGLTYRMTLRPICNLQYCTESSAV